MESVIDMSAYDFKGEEYIGKPVTINFGKKVGTAIAAEDGMITCEIDDEFAEEFIRCQLR